MLFDAIVLGCILASCFLLIVELPYRDLDPNPLVPYIVMDTLNPIFTFVFTVEFAVRVLGQGLLLTKGAYLKDGWNRIDTVVLVCAWLEYIEIPGAGGGGLMKILRMGRAMKPLRLMKRNQSMRMIIDTLIAVLKPLFYVIIFMILMLVVFACIGMQMFGGRLFKCNNPALKYPLGKTECVGVWYTEEGIMMSATWEHPYYFHFDSFGAAMLTLFQINCFNYNR